MANVKTEPSASTGGVSYAGLSMFFERDEFDDSPHPGGQHARANQSNSRYKPSPLSQGVTNGAHDESPKRASIRKTPRRIRTLTSRAVVSRPVSLDLNSDDEIIVSMKRKRVSDKKIADHLRESGRVNYSPKTIGTRFMRIRAKLARARDEELDKGEVAWSAQDDKNLLRAVHAAEQNIDAMKDAAEKTKWDLTSRELSKVDLDGGYSSRACRERYEGLQSDKAVSAAAIFSTPAQTEVKRLQQLADQYNSQLAEAKEAARKEFESVTGVEDDQEVEATESLSDTNLSPSIRAMDVDRELTGMDTWMLRSIRLKEQDKKLEKRLGGINLPVPADMSSSELAAELLARGIGRDGNKQKLETLVKAARAGKKDLPKSIVPADATPLRNLLAKRNTKKSHKKQAVDDGAGDDENRDGDDEYTPPARKRRIAARPL